MKFKKAFALFSTFVVLVSMIGVLPVAAGGGTTRLIPSGGTTSLPTGGFTPSGDTDVTQAEFPAQEDEAAGPGPYPGTIVNRSLSQSTWPLVSVNRRKKAKSHATFNIV